MFNRRAISNRFRSRRDVRLRELIARVPRAGEELRILDLGGRALYWRRVGLDFLRANKVQITLINLPGSVMHGEADEADIFTYRTGSACETGFADNSFDLCHSNSVIEHVGLARDMEKFAIEARRVAPSYFIQTPNFWFPIDPHLFQIPFIHWLPRPARARLLQMFPLAAGGKAKDIGAAFRMADSEHMLTRRQFKFLFPDARIESERLFLLAKSFTAVRIAGQA